MIAEPGRTRRVRTAARSAPPSWPLRKSPEPFGPAATLVGPKAFGLPACRSAPPRAAYDCERQAVGSRPLRCQATGRARGAGPGPGGTWFAGGQGAPPTETQWRWGMAVLLPWRTVRRGSTMVRQTDPWNCSAGEDSLPESSRARLERGGRERRAWRCCSFLPNRSVGSTMRAPSGRTTQSQGEKAGFSR
jgi:hypothetical protein